MPPELPTPKSHTTNSNSSSYLFGSIPVVTHLSSSAIEKMGWVRFDKFKWVKHGRNITYDGAVWLLDGKTIHHIEDLNEANK